MVDAHEGPEAESGNAIRELELAHLVARARAQAPPTMPRWPAVLRAGCRSSEGGRTAERNRRFGS